MQNESTLTSQSTSIDHRLAHILHHIKACLVFFWNAVDTVQTEPAPKAKCISKKAQLSGTHNQVKM